MYSALQVGDRVRHTCPYKRTPDVVDFIDEITPGGEYAHAPGFGWVKTFALTIEGAAK